MSAGRQQLYLISSLSALHMRITIPPHLPYIWPPLPFETADPLVFYNTRTDNYHVVSLLKIKEKGDH